MTGVSRLRPPLPLSSLVHPLPTNHSTFSNNLKRKCLISPTSIFSISQSYFVHTENYNTLLASNL